MRKPLATPATLRSLDERSDPSHDPEGDYEQKEDPTIESPAPSPPFRSTHEPASAYRTPRREKLFGGLKEKAMERIMPRIHGVVTGAS